MEVLVLCIAFGASIVGAICGIGGGVIIKPLLDAFGIASVAEISFLSGCTVLSIEGKHDDLPESAFLFVGTIDEAVAKAQKGE